MEEPTQVIYFNDNNIRNTYNLIYDIIQHNDGFPMKFNVFK